LGIETYTTVNQEALEATDTLLNKSLELFGIAGDNTTIEANIHPTFTLSSLNLLLQTVHSSGGWDSIERHINHSSDTAKGSSLGAGVEALPFGTARLVQVNMSIDQTGQQHMRRVVGIGSISGELRSRDHGIENGGDLAGCS
jgi:hypothetical protein